MPQPANLLKKALSQMFCGANFAKFLRTPFFTVYYRTTASEEYTEVITRRENHVENLMEKQLICRDF